MREVNRKTRKKRRRTSEDNSAPKKGGRKPFHIILIVIYMILMICFSAMLIWLNVLPMKYLIPALAVILIGSFFVVMFLRIRKKRSKRRVVGTVIAIIAIIVYGIGSYYIYSTQDLFSKISTIGQSTEDYYVIVPAEDVEDASAKAMGLDLIMGDDVYVFKSSETPYLEARQKLADHVQINFEEGKNSIEISETLMNGDCNAIFMSSTYYDMSCENIKGFEEATKIIYTITIATAVDNVAKSVDRITTTPFNVCISGNDNFGTIEQVAKSDVNMVMTVNPETKTILLTSIPRDSYVMLHSRAAYDKLTHSGVYGVDETVTTIEDMLSIDINYYIRVNFSTVIEIVDAIGGIDVKSDMAFITHGRQNEGYSFVEGKNHLSGEEALAFSRERYSFTDGDFQRNKNQQKVLKAMLKKVLSSKTLLTKYTQLLDAVKDEMQTNMTTSEMQSLVKMQINDMSGWNIVNYSITGSTGSQPCYTMGGAPASVVIPSTSCITKANTKINNVMNGAEQADGEWTRDYE